MSLLQRAQGQDPAAWQRLVSLYSPVVFHWCRKTGLQPADAADVGQEVFRAVARKLSEFRRDQGGDTFRGWLRAITRNKIRDYFRNRSPEQTGGGRLPMRPAPVLPDAVDDAGQREEVRLVCRRAVDLIREEFNEPTWLAFWAVEIDGRRPADVAADLRLSVNAVYLAKSRVLRRLREEFADLAEPESA